MTLRNLAIWGVIALLVAGLYSMVTQGTKTASTEESYSQLLTNIEAGRVKSAVLKAQTVDVVQTDNSKHTVTTPMDQGDLPSKSATRMPKAGSYTADALTEADGKRRNC